MGEPFESALIACLDALERGEPLEAVLGRYPDLALRLRPALDVARTLARFEVAPAPAEQRWSRQMLLEEADALRQREQRRRRFTPSHPWRAVAVVLVALCISGLGAVRVARAALPNEPLYSVKRVVEQAQLTLATNPQDREDLEVAFDQERHDEVFALLQLNRSAEVAFNGSIESIQPTIWRIDGLKLELNPHTAIQGVAVVGSRVQVQGRTTAGQLVALRIDVEAGTAPTQTEQEPPAAVPTPAPQLSPTSGANGSVPLRGTDDPPPLSLSNTEVEATPPLLTPTPPEPTRTRVPQPTRVGRPTRAPPQAEPSDTPRPTIEPPPVAAPATERAAPSVPAEPSETPRPTIEPPPVAAPATERAAPSVPAEPSVATPTHTGKHDHGDE